MSNEANLQSSPPLGAGQNNPYFCTNCFTKSHLEATAKNKFHIPKKLNYEGC